MNMVIRGYSGKTSVLESFQYDFMTGSLYLFSIVLLASSFGSILIEFTKEIYMLLRKMDYSNDFFSGGGEQLQQKLAGYIKEALI